MEPSAGYPRSKVEREPAKPENALLVSITNAGGNPVAARDASQPNARQFNGDLCVALWTEGLYWHG